MFEGNLLDMIVKSYVYIYISGQISIIPKPELRGFWGSSLIKPPFRVTSADVVIICPDIYTGRWFFATQLKNMLVKIGYIISPIFGVKIPNIFETTT